MHSETSHFEEVTPVLYRTVDKLPITCSARATHCIVHVSNASSHLAEAFIQNNVSNCIYLPRDALLKGTMTCSSNQTTQQPFLFTQCQKTATLCFAVHSNLILSRLKVHCMSTSAYTICFQCFVERQAAKKCLIITIVK